MNEMPMTSSSARSAALSDERIASLLQPFLPAPLPESQVEAIRRYLELLLRWNARINLTAVRDAESIVSRHFGESLFAAARLLPAHLTETRVIDVGSGAGFPGLPLKLHAPAVRLTLIESRQKKAVFLKEVIRTLALPGAEVFAGRAESCAERAELVTLRAVERFDQVLPVAASLLNGAGARLALLIGAPQVELAPQLLPGFAWQKAIAIPQSARRVLLVGERLL